jgi:hypothetical protein
MVPFKSFVDIFNPSELNNESPVKNIDDIWKALSSSFEQYFNLQAYPSVVEAFNFIVPFNAVIKLNKVDL